MGKKTFDLWDFLWDHIWPTILCVVVLSYIIASFIGFNPLDWASAQVSKDSLMLDSHAVADTLGHPNRQGYGDNVWDDEDEQAILKELDCDEDVTSINGVSPYKLKLFIDAAEERAKEAEKRAKKQAKKRK